MCNLRATFSSCTSLIRTRPCLGGTLRIETSKVACIVGKLMISFLLCIEVFDMIRGLAIAQKAIAVGTGSASDGPGTCKQEKQEHSQDGRTRLSYKFCGRDVCQDAFLRLLGIGKNPRFVTLYKAVMSGKQSCPLDPRYVVKGSKDAKAIDSAERGEVWTHLSTLYESVAETLPDDTPATKHEADSDLEDDAQDLIAIVSAHDSFAIGGAASSSTDTSAAALGTDAKAWPRKYLPPGSVFEQWRQFQASGGKAGYKVFRTVWATDFGQCLNFRSKHLHRTCPVCTQHRLLILGSASLSSFAGLNLLNHECTFQSASTWVNCYC